MSDNLYLKGANQVIPEVGNTIELASGCSSQRTTKWWGAGAGKVCVRSAVFTVTTESGKKLNLVIADPAGCRLRIKHDGVGNFEFSEFHRVERAGLFPENDIIPSSLITDFVFPSNPRGVVTTITVGELPKASLIGDVLLSGKGTINMGVSATAPYTVTTTGDSTDNVSTLTVTDKNAKINGNKITFSKAGKYSVKVSVSSTASADSPKTAVLTVTVKAAQPVAKDGQ